MRTVLVEEWVQIPEGGKIPKGSSESIVTVTVKTR